MKRSRIKPYRDTPRRRTAPKETADWWDQATMLLLARCGSRCEKCGQPLGDRLERHHRLKRREGGDRLSNLMALHPECHSWITRNPAEAYDHGWMVPFRLDPGETPVLIGGNMWVLHDDGTRTPEPHHPRRRNVP